MRIPPYHKRKGYQRFFAGLFLGFFGGWLFFLLSFYGNLQEQYIMDIKILKQENRDLKKDLDRYISDYDELNQEIKKKLRIQEIDLKFLNRKQIKLEGLAFLLLQKAVEAELKDIMNKDVETVYQNIELVKKSVENKTYTIDKESFKVKVQNLYLVSTRLELHLKIEKAG